MAIITITKPSSVSSLAAFAAYRANTTNNASAAIQKQLQYQQSINNRNAPAGAPSMVTKFTSYTGPISDAVIRAQQALSQQWGIPTFDAKGNVSTVPTTQLSSLAKTVGVGAYTNLSSNQFVAQLSSIINTIKTTGGQVANTIFNAPTSSTPQNQNPSGGQQGAADPNNTQPPSGASSLGADLAKSLDGIKNYIGPVGILAGLGLVGLLIATRK